MSLCRIESQSLIRLSDKIKDAGSVKGFAKYSGAVSHFSKGELSKLYFPHKKEVAQYEDRDQ